MWEQRLCLDPASRSTFLHSRYSVQLGILDRQLAKTETDVLFVKNFELPRQTI